MLLSQARCESYRAFGAPTKYALRPITVLFGKNNGGKTSLARLPLFSAASLATTPELLAVEAFGIHFGSTFSDIASASQPHPRMRFGLDLDGSISFDITLQLVQRADGQSTTQVSELRLGGTTYKFRLSQSANTSPLEQLSRALTAEHYSDFLRVCEVLRAESNSWLHLKGHRDAVARTYEARPPASFAPEETAYQLGHNRQLLGAVSEWYEAHLDGMRLDVDRSTFALRLVTEPGSQQTVNFADVGRGPQAVLPIITTLTAIRLGMCPAKLVVIEEPEAHVHPSAHGALADLVISASRQAQVIVETHSENFILRLRRRVAEGGPSMPTNEDLSLVYVNDEHQVLPVRIRKDGTTSMWPTGVFEYDVDEAYAILQAQLRRPAP